MHDDDDDGRRLLILPDETVTSIEEATSDTSTLHANPLLRHLASDYARETPWRALQGDDAKATELAMASGARNEVKTRFPLLLRAMRAINSVDIDVALEMSRHLNDLLVVDMKGQHVYSTWCASTGGMAYRFHIGGGVSVSHDGTVILPTTIPETILAALPGRPLSAVVEHDGIFHGNETIAEIVPRRMYGGEWRHAIRIE